MFTFESINISDYLCESNIIDFNNQEIKQKCIELIGDTKNEINIIRKLYHFVRDEIAHSGDINENSVTCIASEVLKNKHGICMAKSHLLAAMLRLCNIPTGFCYQKLSTEVKGQMVVHGLNAVHLSEYNKWIRIDARGNKKNVNAEFNIEEEQIAWQANTSIGEADYPVVLCKPHNAILEIMQTVSTRVQLYDNLYLIVQSVFKNDSV